MRQFFGVDLLPTVSLVGLFLVVLQIGTSVAFFGTSSVVTERISNKTEFVNNVLSDELKLKIVEYTVHVYDWDRDLLKISGRYVFNSPDDNYLYFVDFVEKLDKTEAVKDVLNNLYTKDLITDIRRVERVKPQSFSFQKTFYFG